MADHTVSLTNAEEILLAFLLERINARRASERDEEGVPLPPFTLLQLVNFAVKNDLNNLRKELHDSTQEIFRIAQGLTAAQRTALLNQIPDGARKTWLQARITQGQ